MPPFSACHADAFTSVAYSGNPACVVLLTDEADAFLRRRDTANVSEGVRAALNVMLSRTGGASKDFVLVLATNRPEDLDEALLDRVDEVLEFDLPGKVFV